MTRKPRNPRAVGESADNGGTTNGPATDTGGDQHDVLGAYIRAQRQLADLSLRQLATLSNVSNAYLSQVERGLHQPSLKVLRSIADALDISTEHMLAQAGVVTAGARAFGQGAEPSRVNRDTVEAILADKALREDEKQAMLALYKTFVNRH